MKKEQILLLNLTFYQRQYIRKQQADCFEQNPKLKNGWSLRRNDSLRVMSPDIISAYNILNDLCVHYYKNLFPASYPQEIWDKEIINNEYSPNSFGEYITIKVLHLLQQNKKDEAEKYIMANSILNK